MQKLALTALEGGFHNKEGHICAYKVDTKVVKKQAILSKIVVVSYRTRHQHAVVKYVWS